MYIHVPRDGPTALGGPCVVYWPVNNTAGLHDSGTCTYCIAGYIGGNNIWRIGRKRKKIAIGGYKFGSYGMIATPSPGVYAVGAILADLILAV